MNHTRRDILVGASSLAATTGCLGSGDRTATPGEPSVRIWPHSVTAIFRGSVEQSTIYDASYASPESSWTYQLKGDDEKKTYYVSTAPISTVSRARNRFGNAGDIAVERVYRGVGPKYREKAETVIGQQAAGVANVSEKSVALSSGISDDHQYLDLAAPTAPSALVPVLPEMEVRRVGSDNDTPLLGPDHFDTEKGVRFSIQSSGQFTFWVTDEGIERFRRAVVDASDEAIQDSFMRLVVEGESLGTYPLTEYFATTIEEGNWDGTLRVQIWAAPVEEDPITAFTDLPPVPFECEVLD